MTGHHCRRAGQPAGLWWVVTHITGRDAGRPSSAGVAAISSYLMVSDNVKPSKTGATAIWSRRWGVGGVGGGEGGGWKGGGGKVVYT